MLNRVLQPRTVLMTADTMGGVWTYALDLARELERQGVGTVLATMGRVPRPTQRDAALAIPGLILEESAFRLEWMEDAAADVESAGAWLLELERKHRPDVVHVNGFVHAALPFAAPTVLVAHSCVGSWWRAVRGEAAPDRFDGYAEGVRRGLAEAAAVVAPTMAFLDQVRALYGPIPNGRVILNGRDPAPFAPAPKRDMVLSAGRGWDEAKNITALDRIAADLPWPVVVAGDWRPPSGAAVPPVNLLCLDLVEPERLRHWLGEAAIFALPARYEPFGLAPLEAALSGCALVLGDLPTLREVWGDAACYVRPDDLDGLRATLLELIRDPDHRRRMAARAGRRARRFTARRMAANYLALYRELLALHAGYRIRPHPGARPAEAAPVG